MGVNVYVAGQWRIQTRRFRGPSSKVGANNLHLFKYPSFSATIVGNHRKVVIPSRSRKCLFFLVEPCDHLGESPQFKIAFYHLFKKGLQQIQKDMFHFSQSAHN